MANTKAIMTTVILIIIAVVVIFQIIGSTSETMVNSSRSVLYDCGAFTDSAGNDYYLNLTDTVCYNGSNLDPQSATTNQLPLSSLFAPDGIVWIVFMAMILLLVAGIVFVKMKKR